jgi:hypothetical protein
MLLGKTLRIIQKGWDCEGRIVQKRAGSRMDVLPLSLIDYSRPAEAVSFYTMRAADAASLIGKISSLSPARCMTKTLPEILEFLTAD